MMPPSDSQLLHAMAILLLERNLPCEDKPAPEGAEGGANDPPGELNTKSAIYCRSNGESNEPSFALTRLRIAPPNV